MSQGIQLLTAIDRLKPIIQFLPTQCLRSQHLNVFSVQNLKTLDVIQTAL